MKIVQTYYRFCFFCKAPCDSSYFLVRIRMRLSTMGCVFPLPESWVERDPRFGSSLICKPARIKWVRVWNLQLSPLKVDQVPETSKHTDGQTRSKRKTSVKENLQKKKNQQLAVSEMNYEKIRLFYNNIIVRSPCWWIAASPIMRPSMNSQWYCLSSMAYPKLF